jgi:hypothetical protein
LALPVVRGVLLAVPVLAVFTVLLTSADSIFARYVEDAFRADFFSNLFDRLWHLELMAAVAWLVAGGLFVALRRVVDGNTGRDGADTATAGAAETPLVTNVRLGFGEAATVLALVDVLFALFVWVQFAYLFSGAAARTMHFEEYRLYARHGFGELLAVSVLTLLLIVGLRAVTWRPEWRTWEAVGQPLGPSNVFAPVARRVRLFNVLCTIMVALALVMLASAFQRMLFWERVDYYINTGTRLYVRWFIVWLALTFGWLVVTLWRRPDRFAIGAFVAALGFLVTMNLQNPDADVAAYNLARRDELSTRYLALLSDDAVPTLAAALADTTDAAQADRTAETDDALPADVRERLRQDLAFRLERLDGTAAAAGWWDWPAFHVGRWRAHRALTMLHQQGLL